MSAYSMETIELPKSMKIKLEKIALKKGVNVEELIIALLQEHVLKYPPQTAAASTQSVD